MRCHSVTCHSTKVSLLFNSLRFLKTHVSVLSMIILDMNCLGNTLFHLFNISETLFEIFFFNLNRKCFDLSDSLRNEHLGVYC